ncbi:MAG: NIL domain-containing protein [Deltaproteobacteria bacterium]|nr:NIL domain-containing protein [Deltaproteobacteria bacterium]
MAQSQGAGGRSKVLNLSPRAKPKKDIVRDRIYLTFPKELVKEPIVCWLAKKPDVVFSIRSSTVTANMGLVALEIDGEREEVDKATHWLKEKGVRVEPIEKNVIE